MKKIFDYVVLSLLILLITISNNSIFGIKYFKDEKEFVFDKIKVPHSVVYTMPVAKSISGYGGPIPMVVAVGKDGKILDIEILKNAESPTYLGPVIEYGYLDNWIGKSVEAAANVEVDAVSGATLSSTAIAKSIKATMQVNSGQEVKVEKTFDKKGFIRFMALLSVLGFALLSFFKPKRFTKHRSLMLASSVLVLGVWQGQMLSTVKVSTWIINGVSSLAGIGLLLIFIISLLISIFTGRQFYCTYLCPFGGCQELMGNAISVKNSKLSKRIPKSLSKVRFILLYVSFVLLIFELGNYIVNLEPFSAFKINNAPVIAIIIFSMFLILSVFITRPWCKYFCPFGAFMRLFNKK